MTLTNGVTLMTFLSEINDPRKPSNGALHDCLETMVIAVAAALSDYDTVEDIAYGARAKETWLRKFLMLTSGVPFEYTSLRIFRVLGLKQFERTSRRCVGSALSGNIVVDGKTLRRSSGGEIAIHMASAFPTDLGIIFGQEKASGVSNEIAVIPELLSALCLKGVLRSIAATGCQRKTASEVTDHGGDSVLAVKGNQPTLLEAIETAFIDQHESEGVDRQHEVQKGYGRIVGQMASILPAQGIMRLAVWCACETVGRIDYLRKVGDKVSELERRYYISSRVLTAEKLAAAERAHGGVESRLHWIRDVSFGEDGSTIRKENAPQTFSLLKNIVFNMIRRGTTTKTKNQTQLTAEAHDDLRMYMLCLSEL